MRRGEKKMRGERLSIFMRGLVVLRALIVLTDESLFYLRDNLCTRINI